MQCEREESWEEGLKTTPSLPVRSGTEITFSCDPGFTLTGATEGQCDEYGTVTIWDAGGHDPQCKGGSVKLFNCLISLIISKPNVIASRQEIGGGITYNPVYSS